MDTSVTAIASALVAAIAIRDVHIADRLLDVSRVIHDVIATLTPQDSSNDTTTIKDCCSVLVVLHDPLNDALIVAQHPLADDLMPETAALACDIAILASLIEQHVSNHDTNTIRSKLTTLAERLLETATCNRNAKQYAIQRIDKARNAKTSLAGSLMRRSVLIASLYVQSTLHDHYKTVCNHQCSNPTSNTPYANTVCRLMATLIFQLCNVVDTVINVAQHNKDILPVYDTNYNIDIPEPWTDTKRYFQTLKLIHSHPLSRLIGVDVLLEFFANVSSDNTDVNVISTLAYHAIDFYSTNDNECGHAIDIRMNSLSCLLSILNTINGMYSLIPSTRNFIPNVHKLYVAPISLLTTNALSSASSLISNCSRMHGTYTTKFVSRLETLLISQCNLLEQNDFIIKASTSLDFEPQLLKPEHFLFTDYPTLHHPLFLVYSAQHLATIALDNYIKSLDLDDLAGESSELRTFYEQLIKLPIRSPLDSIENPINLSCETIVLAMSIYDQRALIEKDILVDEQFRAPRIPMCYLAESSILSKLVSSWNDIMPVNTVWYNSKLLTDELVKSQRYEQRTKNAISAFLTYTIKGTLPEWSEVRLIQMSIGPSESHIVIQHRFKALLVIYKCSLLLELSSMTSNTSLVSRQDYDKSILFTIDLILNLWKQCFDIACNDVLRVAKRIFYESHDIYPVLSLLNFLVRETFTFGNKNLELKSLGSSLLILEKVVIESFEKLVYIDGGYPFSTFETDQELYSFTDLISLYDDIAATCRVIAIYLISYDETTGELTSIDSIVKRINIFGLTARSHLLKVKEKIEDNNEKQDTLAVLVNKVELLLHKTDSDLFKDRRTK